MKLLAEVLSEYLSKEDLQRIARDHDLPVSRTKDEIVGELLSLDDLEPIEAVAFMSVWQLRTFCQEHGLPSGAYRDTLVERVVEAIEAEDRPRERRPRSIRPSPPAASSRGGAEQPLVARARAPPTIEVEVPPASQPPITVRMPPAPPVPIEVQVHPTPPASVSVRVFPAQVAALGFVGIVAAVIFGGIYFLTTAILGTLWGVVVGLVAGIVTGVVLLVTEHRWSAKLNLVADRGRAP